MLLRFLPPRSACLLAFALPALLGGCFEFERTQRTSVPPALLGEWRGNWASAQNMGTGEVLLSVQTFEGEPLLQLDTQHPCLVERSYEFVQQGAIWELRRDGRTLFRAELDADERRLVGTYDCTADRGSWSAQWNQELPAIPDLGGTWTGTFAGAEPRTTGSLVLELDQELERGVLALRGVVRMPDLEVEMRVTNGQILWVDDRFDLALQAGGAPWPVLLLQGIGDRASRAVQDGILVVDHPRVPFRLGLWTAAWQAP